jgi:fluoroquinolone transport system ATP-binding protein
MVEVKNLRFSYSKDKQAIKDVFLNIDDHQVFGILGSEKSGKTTIINLLAGVYEKYTGDIYFGGKNIRVAPKKQQCKLGIVFKSPKMYARFTARENLKFFAGFCKYDKGNIVQAMEKVGLQNDMDKKVYQYSQSMVKRLAVARAIMVKPKLLLFDEPLFGIDDYSKKIIHDLILKQKNDGVTILIASKDGTLLKSTCDKIGFLVDGQIKKISAPSDYDKKGRLIETSYYYKRSIIEQIIDTANPTDRELLANIIRRNDIKTIHSNESTLNDVLAYYNQEGQAH